MLSWSPWTSLLSSSVWARGWLAIGAGVRSQMHAPSGVLIGGRLLQCFLCRINNEAQIIAVSHDLDRGEWNCHFLFTDTEKSSDTDERSSDGAIGCHDEIADRPDLVAGAIVHASVEVRTRQDATGRSSREIGNALLRQRSRRARKCIEFPL